MAKNTIIMIGDGFGWEMARAAAIYKQIQAGNPGTKLSDFYTSGEGTGLNLQTLKGYTYATTYGTTIAGTDGVFNAGISALNGATFTTPTGTAPIRTGFAFNPTFNPGTTPNGGAKVSDGVVGNLVGYDPVKGGINPWTPGTDSGYIKNSYPDSANTATTLYSGVKSYNGAIGVDIFEKPVESILSRAASVGKSTGLVTSVPIDHATPAAAAANVNNRNKFDGDLPALDNILQQELRIFQPTVLLGGGHPLSNTGNPLPTGVEPRDNTYIKESTYQELSKKPTTNIYDYTFLERGTNAAQTLATTAAQLDPEKGDRLLGLYGARGQDGNLPVSSADGDYSTTGLAIFTNNSTKGLNPDTVRPLLPGETDASFIAKERNENPTLDDLTKAALSVLGKDPDGLWLMIEGGDIDWAAHDNNIDNLIGTVLDFDKAVGSVINWINQNGGWADNELIITADHDHYLNLTNDFPTLLRTKGAEQLTAIDTIAESGNFWGNSATDKYDWGTHTNRPVPVYYQGVDSPTLTSSIGQGFDAYGFKIPGLANAVDQVNIAQTMFASVTEVNQENFVAGTTGADTLIALQNIDGVQDTVFSGAGNDEVDLAFNSNARNNIIDTGSGNDKIYISRNDVAFGSDGNDEFDARDGKGENRLSGGAGDDTFYLGSNDRALGGSGNDKFFVGLSGGNLLSGGAGADQFWIVNAELPKAANTILDFQIGTDVIGISGAKSLGITTANLTLTQVGADTAVIFGGQTLATLTGIQASALSVANPNQFVLV
jgi:alkaline phosphatase